MAKLFIVAGEESGDLHGAELIKALRLLDPTIEIYGVGGLLMEAQGAHLLRQTSGKSVVGYIEALKHLKFYKQVMSDIVSWVNQNRPDAVIVIDSPGFNLRLAPKLYSLDVPLIYFISPQVWAWGQGRIKLLKKYFKKILCILPFEPEFFKKYDIAARYVGNPLVDVVQVTRTRDELFREMNFNSNDFLVSLLPGSRNQEYDRLLPVMLESAQCLQKEIPNIRFVLILVDEKFKSQVESNPFVKGLNLTLVTQNRYDWRAASDLSIVCSGTATLEGALIKTPMIIVYRVSPISAFIGRRLIKVPFAGLVNLVAGELIVPELLQESLSTQSLTSTALNLIRDKNARNQMREKLSQVRAMLGEGGAAHKAAQEIISLIKK